jgi:predicted esterase
MTIFALSPWTTASAVEIFNRYIYSSPTRSPTETYEEDRIITGHQGASSTLGFRVSLYGSAGQKMPLVVQVHEWGGDFARMEELASYIPTQYEFVMLYFQFKPSTENETNWWFGTHWEGVCRMWTHEAVMEIVREVIGGSLVSSQLGASIDLNRVYLFGHSIGGTGAWQLGVRNPDVFAAIHAHSGFARFTPPVGPFEGQFITDIVGGPSEGIAILDAVGTSYSARDYSNLVWWLSNYHDSAFETPFINITAGTEDEIVSATSGGDFMRQVLDSQKRGFFYYRHSGGHSSVAFVQMNWMWNFRLNQSFLAFTNRSGYGIKPDQTVNPWVSNGYASGGINNLYEFGWDPDTIIDQPGQYRVQLTGSGTADVTFRRLQAFKVTAGAAYNYWLDNKSGTGTTVYADANGLLTIAAVSGPRLLIVEAVDGPPASIHPDIKANNSDGPVNINSGDAVSITISLDPGSYEAQNADWWIVEKTPSGVYKHYDLSTHSMISGLALTHQGALFNLHSTQLLNSTDLTVGTHTFYLGVDLNMNGSLDMDSIYYDSVSINVTGP